MCPSCAWVAAHMLVLLARPRSWLEKLYPDWYPEYIHILRIDPDRWAAAGGGSGGSRPAGSAAGAQLAAAGSTPTSRRTARRVEKADLASMWAEGGGDEVGGRVRSV